MISVLGMEEETNREEELRIQVELQTPSPGVQPVEEEETDENLAKYVFNIHSYDRIDCLKKKKRTKKNGTMCCCSET